MMMTDKERLEADEYEKQYYGFSSTQFYTDFCFQYEKFLQDTIKATEAGFMVEESLEYDTNMISLRAQKLYIAFMEVAKVPLVKLKEECRKMFGIPKNVLLEADQCKLKDYTEKDLIQLKLDIAKLEDNLIKEQILLSKRGCLKEVIDGSIMPMYDKVNNLLSCEEVFQQRKKCNEDKRQLSDNLLLDETLCTVNYKLKGYALLKGSPRTMKIDLPN